MAEKLPIYCHQCRRYMRDVFGCTNFKKHKLCIMKYCQKCIVRQYPSEEAERAQLGNWVCPRCREMCTCSECRKKKGLSPIGKKHTKVDQDKLFPEILKFPAYANHILRNVAKMQKKSSAITNWKETYQSRSGSRKYVEMADHARKELTVLQGQESLLPKATIPITKVAGIDMAVENVGPALQFLEHCRNFSQIVYNLNDGEAKRILDEIIQGWDGSSGQLSVLEKFQRDMLTIILADKKTQRSSSSGSSLAGDAWVASVERLIDSESLFRNVPRGYFQSDSCYHQLDANWKLLILNFLCDLVLVTKKLKRIRPIPKETEFNWKKLPASQKVIALWKELKEEEGKAVPPLTDGMVLTFEEEEEYERRLLALKEEFRKAYIKMLEALADHNLCPERRAKRVKPLMTDTSGRIFFQIEGYMECSSIVVQDVENWDTLSNKDSIDKWYVFPEGDGTVIEEYCSSKRIWEGILNSALEHIPDGILQDRVPDLNTEKEPEVSMQDHDDMTDLLIKSKEH